MTAAADTPPPAFSARVVLALVLVGILAFSGLSVLSAYAPDLRASQDGRAHALSRSAVGYAGAPILMKALGHRALVSRTRTPLGGAAVVLTPDGRQKPEALSRFLAADRILIVLPKWVTIPDPLRSGFVRKVAPLPPGPQDEGLLHSLSKETILAQRKGVARVVLKGTDDDGPFAAGTALPLGPIDHLQTVSGGSWVPALVDESGAAVLAYSRRNPKVLLLADPDLLNNQGLANLDNARAGAAILDVLSDGGGRTLIFDVTLNGFERGRGLGRLMLEPPWLAATLIGVAAAILMGIHALARFGQPRPGERAFALGARALVDNAADLVRMARKEHEMALPYAMLTRASVLRAAGSHVEEGWLEELARRRGAASPGELAVEAEKARTRDDLLAVARKLHAWRGEMIRERR